MYESAGLLMVVLLTAVPLYIAELQRLQGETRTNQVRVWAAAAVDVLACQGDVLQYGGARGEAAHVFNHLARALAALAHTPGGVSFAGTHWCVQHPMGTALPAHTLSCNTSGVESDTRTITVAVPMSGFL